MLGDRSWPVAAVRVACTDPRPFGRHAPATAVDESGMVSADYSNEFPWKKVSDNNGTPSGRRGGWLRFVVGPPAAGAAVGFVS